MQGLPQRSGLDLGIRPLLARLLAVTSLNHHANSHLSSAAE